MRKRFSLGMAVASLLFVVFAGRAFAGEACQQVFDQKKKALDEQVERERRAVKEKFARQRRSLRKARKRAKQEYQRKAQALIEAKAKAGKALERAEWNCQPLFDAWESKMNEVRSTIEIAKIAAQSKDPSRFEKLNKEVKKLMEEANQIKTRWEDCLKESKAAKKDVNSLKKDLRKAQSKLDAFEQKIKSLKRSEREALQRVDQRKQRQLRVLQLELEKCKAIVKGKMSFEYEHIDEELKKYKEDIEAKDSVCSSCSWWKQTLRALKKELGKEQKKYRQTEKELKALKEKRAAMYKELARLKAHSIFLNGVIADTKKVLKEWKEEERKAKKEESNSALVVIYRYQITLNQRIIKRSKEATKTNREIVAVINTINKLEASVSLLSQKVKAQALKVKRLKEAIERAQWQLKLCRYKNSCQKRVKKREKKKKKKTRVAEEKKGETMISVEGDKTKNQKKKRETKKEAKKKTKTDRVAPKKRSSPKPIAYLLAPQLPKEMQKDFQGLPKTKRQEKEIQECFAIALKYGMAKQKVEEIEKMWRKANEEATAIAHQVSVWEGNLKTMKRELDEAEREMHKAQDAFFDHLSSPDKSVRKKYMKEMHRQEDAYKGMFDSYWALKDKIKIKMREREKALDREKALFKQRIEANRLLAQLTKAYEECQKKVKGAALKEKEKFQIQKAIDNAQSGDTVVVPPGIYTKPVVIKDKTITLRSQDPDDSDIVKVTVLDGMNEDNVITLENSDAVIEGLTIQNGKGLYGGGVLVKGGAPTIQKNRIKENKALKSGGGVALIGTTKAKMKENVIQENRAFLDGGGVFQLDGIESEIMNNLFAENKAAQDGGGFAEKSVKRKLPEGMSWAKVKENTFKQNKAGVSGGGLKACVSGFSLRENLFESNIAGGLPFVSFAPAERDSLITVHFSDKILGKGGGAAICETSTSLAPGAKWTLSIDGNTFKGNKAPKGGTALSFDPGIPGLDKLHLNSSNIFGLSSPQNIEIAKGKGKGGVVVSAVGCPECQKLWEDAKMAEDLYKSFLEDFPHLEKDIQELNKKREALKKEIAPKQKKAAELEKKIAEVDKSYFKIRDEIAFNKKFSLDQYKKGNITIWNAGYFTELDEKNAKLEKKIYPLMKKKASIEGSLNTIRAELSPKEDELFETEQLISSKKSMLKVIKKTKKDWERSLAQAKACQKKCEEKKQLETLIHDIGMPKKKKRKVTVKIVQVIPREGNDPFDAIDPLQGESTEGTTVGNTYKGIACGFDTITVLSLDATKAEVVLKDNPTLTFTFGAPSLFAGPPHPTIPAQVYEAANVNVSIAVPPNLTMDLQIDANSVIMWAGDTATGWLACSGEFAKQ